MAKTINAPTRQDKRYLTVRGLSRNNTGFYDRHTDNLEIIAHARGMSSDIAGLVLTKYHQG